MAIKWSSVDLGESGTLSLQMVKVVLGKSSDILYIYLGEIDGNIGVSHNILSMVGLVVPLSPFEVVNTFSLGLVNH